MPRRLIFLKTRTPSRNSPSSPSRTESTTGGTRRDGAQHDPNPVGSEADCGGPGRNLAGGVGITPLLQVLYTVRSERMLMEQLDYNLGDSDADPGNPTVNLRGEKRSNKTHASTMDPEALLARLKGRESKLAYRGHLLTENRHGLVVDARLTPADGFAVRRAALAMLERVPGRQRVPLGADRGYDVRSFVPELRQLHVAQNTTRQSSSIDGRTTRHVGYPASPRRRKRIEEVFGWMKTIGSLRKAKYRGDKRVGWTFVFTAAVYNRVRMRTLMAATA